jgi:hypothetical protein
VKDDAQNARQYSGSFSLSEPKDTTNPTGRISGISSSYTAGNTVSYTVKGWDNKKLYRLSFGVTDRNDNTKHTKSWNVSGTSVEKSYSFSTSGWSAGTYYYALWVKDDAQNAREYSGSFTLSEPRDTTNPTSIPTFYGIRHGISYRITTINFTYSSGRISCISRRHLWDTQEEHEYPTW